MKAKILALAVGGFLALMVQRPAWGEDICGDAFITGSEECDDACGFDGCDEFDNGDGCSSTCTIEPGWACEEFDVDFFSFCFTICGDGIQAGFEQCDDGNAINGDGCDTDFTGACVLTGCGNFVVTPDSVEPYADEACDDGNTLDGDGCSADCTAVEPGWVCEDFGYSFCHTNCGDGIFAGQEECEDGNGVNGDGCDDDVDDPLSPGNCTFTSCGNLVQTEGEDCDDGKHCEDGTSCFGDSYCFGIGDELCLPREADFVTDFCDSNCTIPQCGNGIVDHIDIDTLKIIEPCDDANGVNGDGCDNNCTLTACGNGILTEGEICDDGNTANDDGCSAACKPECGDGVQGVNEGCDDGNVSSGDGCSSVCTVEGAADVCGNGIREAGEECDDGNTTSGDGCDADCTDQDFESANPVLVFSGLIEGDSVILNSPDPRDSSSAPAGLVLPSTCACTWSISPLALGRYSSATECQTQLTLDREGNGQISVETDCGLEGSGTFLQSITVQPRPAPESGGCALISSD